MVPSRKQATHKLPGTEGSLLGTKRVPRPLRKQHSPDSNRQNHSGCLHKERGGGDEIRPSVCPSLENYDLVYQQIGYSHGPTHPRSAERSSRQAIQTKPDNSNRVVSPSRSLPGNVQQVAPKVQQASPVWFASTGPPGSAVDALTLSWENLDPYAFPPAAILGKVVEKLQDYPFRRIILIAPGWPNMPWFWDLMTMSSQIQLSLPYLPNLLTQPFNQTPHRNLSNLNLHAWLLEPQQSRSRASLRQWQHELRLFRED